LPSGTQEPNGQRTGELSDIPRRSIPNIHLFGHKSQEWSYMVVAVSIRICSDSSRLVVVVVVIIIIVAVVAVVATEAAVVSR
jgi:hypothetical protein